MRPSEATERMTEREKERTAAKPVLERSGGTAASLLYRAVDQQFMGFNENEWETCLLTVD